MPREWKAKYPGLLPKCYRTLVQPRLHLWNFPENNQGVLLFIRAIAHDILPPHFQQLLEKYKNFHSIIDPPHYKLCIN